MHSIFKRDLGVLEVWRDYDLITFFLATIFWQNVLFKFSLHFLILEFWISLLPLSEDYAMIHFIWTPRGALLTQYSLSPLAIVQTKIKHDLTEERTIRNRGWCYRFYRFRCLGHGTWTSSGKNTNACQIREHLPPNQNIQRIGVNEQVPWMHKLVQKHIITHNQLCYT